MNKTKISDPDNLLKRALKDELPPEVEKSMNREFLHLKRTLDRGERLPEPGERLWIHGLFRREILAVVSAAMIILGIVVQLSGSSSALAHSIERLKVIVTLSVSLNRVSSMDCTLLKSGDEGEQTSYRVRWRTEGDVRVDMSADDGSQTLWISNETISIAGPGDKDIRSISIKTMTPGPVWLPALEFQSPELLGKHIKDRYGLMQISGRASAGSNEFLIVGREGQQKIGITVDAKTYLPRELKKYALDMGKTNGGRDSMMEVRFRWDQLIPPDLFIPRSLAEKQ